MPSKIFAPEYQKAGSCDLYVIIRRCDCNGLN